MCRDKLVYDIGTIKLADFGLSKSLPYNKHAQYDLDETFKLTGETGSYRYMVRAHMHRWLLLKQSALHGLQMQHHQQTQIPGTQSAYMMPATLWLRNLLLL